MSMIFTSVSWVTSSVAPSTSIEAFTLSILLIRDFGPVILIFSGLEVREPTSYLLSGFVLLVVTFTTNSCVSLSSRWRLKLFGVTSILFGKTFSQETVIGTITGSVSRLTACCRSAVARRSATVSLSRILRCALIVTRIGVCSLSCIHILPSASIYASFRSCTSSRSDCQCLQPGAIRLLQ